MANVGSLACLRARPITREKCINPLYRYMPESYARGDTRRVHPREKNVNSRPEIAEFQSARSAVHYLFTRPLIKLFGLIVRKKKKKKKKPTKHTVTQRTQQPIVPPPVNHDFLGEKKNLPAWTSKLEFPVRARGGKARVLAAASLSQFPAA